MAAFPALLVNVTTAVIDDVLPIAVLGNENVAGLTVNCDETAGAGAPPRTGLELELELELDVDDEDVVLDAADGTGRLAHPAVRAIHVSITAAERQWLRQWIIETLTSECLALWAKASNPAWTGARRVSISSARVTVELQATDV
jgi:hypothetical protein